MRAAIFVCTFIGVAHAQRTYLIDALPNGGPPSQGARTPDVSRTGRYVTFESSAPNLVTGDLNGVLDVFLRDMQTGQYELISVSSGGAQASSASRYPRMTPDARFVAFLSSATNLAAPNDVSAHTDAFVRDRQLGTTIKISVTPSGGESVGATNALAISDDGTRICFSSAAPDFFPGDPYAFYDVFVRDVALGTTSLASSSLGGSTGNHHSELPTISGDGRFVAFQSEASDLVAGDTNAEADVFVRDLASGTIVRASVSSSGAQSNGDSSNVSLSADGRIVAFQSFATNLVTPDSGVTLDILVRDLVAGTTTRVSQSASGVQADSGSWYPALSADGRYVAFLSYAYNLLPAPSLHLHALVRVDRTNGQVIETAGSVCGVPIDQVVQPRISADGNVIVFASDAHHAAPLDANNTLDAFLHDVTAAPVPQVCAYCTVAPTSNGCTPVLSVSGLPSASAGSGCMLDVTSIEGQRVGAFIHSPYSVLVPWNGGGASYRCVERWQTNGLQTTGGTLGQCDGTMTLDLNAALPWTSQVGKANFVQAWFRDPGSTKGTSLAPALSYVLGP